MTSGIALDRAGEGLEKRRLLRARIAIIAAFFGCGFFTATWLVHVVGTKTRLGINDGQLGLALWCGAGGLFLGMMLAAAIIGKLGSYTATWVSAAGLGLATVLPVICPVYFLLCPALLLFGFCSGLLDGSMNTQAGHLQRVLGRPIMSSTHACWTVGNLGGAILGGVLIGIGTPAAIHVCLAVLLFFPVLIWMRANLLEVVEPKASGISIAIPRGNLILLGLISLCSMLAEGAIADWSGVFLKEKFITTQAMSTLGYTGFFSLMFLARIFGDWTTGKFGVQRSVIFGLIAAGGGLFLSANSSNLFFGVAGFAIAGFGVANVVPLAFGAAADSRADEVGHSVTAVASLGYIGLFSGPALVGGLASAISLKFAIGMVATLLIFASALGFKAFRPKAKSAS